MKRKVLEVMAEVMQIPVDMINENTTMDELEEWDSLMHVMIIGALDTELGISIPLEKSIEITCVKELLELCDIQEG